jgi:hypothetical protein
VQEIKHATPASSLTNISGANGNGSAKHEEEVAAPAGD